MPILEIATNIPKEKVTSDIILNLSKELAAVIGKPEKFIVIRVLTDQLMSFIGSLDPCGTAVLKSIGNLGVEENKAISSKMFSFIKENLGIPDDRLYIQFVDMSTSEVGYKGTTFHEIFGR